MNTSELVKYENCRALKNIILRAATNMAHANLLHQVALTMDDLLRGTDGDAIRDAMDKLREGAEGDALLEEPLIPVADEPHEVVVELPSVPKQQAPTAAAAIKKTPVTV